MTQENKVITINNKTYTRDVKDELQQHYLQMISLSDSQIKEYKLKHDKEIVAKNALLQMLEKHLDEKNKKEAG
jgi:molybdopterin biosynthesis enzyme MoaB